MLYNYLSDCTPLVHIPIKVFLKKFKLLWPKKNENAEDEEGEGAVS